VNVGKSVSDYHAPPGGQSLRRPLPVLAYLDPGSGTVIVQVILGGFAGVAVLAKLFWRRLRRPLSRTTVLDRDESVAE